MVWLLFFHDSSDYFSDISKKKVFTESKFPVLIVVISIILQYAIWQQSVYKIKPSQFASVLLIISKILVELIK